MQVVELICGENGLSDILVVIAVIGKGLISHRLKLLKYRGDGLLHQSAELGDAGLLLVCEFVLVWIQSTIAQWRHINVKGQQRIGHFAKVAQGVCDAILLFIKHCHDVVDIAIDGIVQVVERAI